MSVACNPRPILTPDQLIAARTCLRHALDDPATSERQAIAIVGAWLTLADLDRAPTNPTTTH